MGANGSLLAKSCAFLVRWCSFLPHATIVLLCSFGCSKFRSRIKSEPLTRCLPSLSRGIYTGIQNAPPSGCHLSLGPNAQPPTTDRLTPPMALSLSVPPPAPQLCLPLQVRLLPSLSRVLRRTVRSNIVGGTINSSLCRERSGLKPRATKLRSVIDHRPVEDGQITSLTAAGSTSSRF
jgi:hypothetical protein